MALHLHFDVGLYECCDRAIQSQSQPAHLRLTSLQDPQRIVTPALVQALANQIAVGFADAGPEQGEGR